MSASELFESSSPEKEGIYRASKWLSTHVLLDVSEIKDLLQLFQPVIVETAGLLSIEKGMIPHEEFLEVYQGYQNFIQGKKEFDEEKVRMTCSSAWTLHSKDFYSLPLGEGKHLIRPRRPVIQLQLHSWAFSEESGQIRPMIQGKNSIHWGVQFSYPQIFQNPQTQEIHETFKEERFLNTPFFRQLQKWLRKHSIPTTFLIHQKVIRTPLRLGKKCFDWIHQHQQLRQREWKVQIPKG